MILRSSAFSNEISIDSKDSSILLDCGAGTLGQLYRFYGDQTHDILKNLRGIFISHMHLDHFMGEFRRLWSFELQAAELFSL